MRNTMINLSGKMKNNRCEVCKNSIPLTRNSSRGETITCYECGTQYLLTLKSPRMIFTLEGSYDHDDHVDHLHVDDHEN